MEELQERNLIEEGDPVDIPDVENKGLIEENYMSVIAVVSTPLSTRLEG